MRAFPPMGFEFDLSDDMAKLAAWLLSPAGLVVGGLAAINIVWRLTGRPLKRRRPRGWSWYGGDGGVGGDGGGD